MTFAGLDVHARSTHGAAIDVLGGELRRVRFGPGSEPVVAWLGELPQPVYACYEAGPTGFALYRAAVEAGLRVDVIAPSKTPRAPGDRIKSDRKDAELLARLLLAGQLKTVTVSSATVEAARHLCRAREQVRSDLMRCRHRVSNCCCSTVASTSSRPLGMLVTGSGWPVSGSRSPRPSSPSSTRWRPSTGWSPASVRSMRVSRG